MFPSLPRSVALACVVATCSAHAQLPPGDGPASVNASVVDPTPLPFNTGLLDKLTAPPGFKVTVYASGLQNVRWLQVAPNGDVYVSRRTQGDVLLLRDTDRDGRADQMTTVAQNIPQVHGLALKDKKLYLASDRKLFVADVNADGTLGPPATLTDDLPSAGQHPNRTLAFGPDGKLYLTIGSDCNACNESTPEAATLVTVSPDGKARSVVAKGLRNTIGFGWHPVSGALYGFDHGSDFRGDDQPPEELNHIRAGKDYGWPFCYGDKKVDGLLQHDPPNTSKADFCPTTEAPSLTYTAHSAPIGMVFYTAQNFPQAYRNDAFVAMRGSWNRAQPSGYKVVRVRFDANGQPQLIEDFVTGWLQPPASGARPTRFGRPAGLAVAQDGSLLIAEDENGVIYRVTYSNP